jgi:hypothetical protein
MFAEPTQVGPASPGNTSGFECSGALFADNCTETMRRLLRTNGCDRIRRQMSIGLAGYAYPYFDLGSDGRLFLRLPLSSGHIEIH